jgi:hypothetical protein
MHRIVLLVPTYGTYLRESAIGAILNELQLKRCEKPYDAMGLDRNQYAICNVRRPSRTSNGSVLLILDQAPRTVAVRRMTKWGRTNGAFNTAVSYEKNREHVDTKKVVRIKAALRGGNESQFKQC